MATVTFLRRSLNIGLVLAATSVLGRVGIGAFTAPALVGCSITATDGGLILKTQKKYASQAVQKQTMTPWTSQGIVVHNANGNVTVNGNPSATTVTVSATPFAFADPDKPNDATSALQDITNSLGIDETSGQFTVHCGQSSQQYGSAGVATSGCDLTVTVPAGSAAQGVPLTAHTGNGDVSGSNLYAASGTQIQIATDNGGATATNVTGSVKVHTGNGDASGSAAPTQGSQIEVSSDNGNATLSLPANFECDTLKLSAPGGMVKVASGFSNQITSASTSVGTMGMGASVITVTAGTLGDATLQPQ